MKTPKLLETKELLTTPYFSVRQDTILLKGIVDGEKLKMEKDYYLIEANDFVSIIVANGDKVLITKQYRYPIQEFSIEFVAGYCDGQKPKEAAKRELLEEAGLIANELVYLGKIYPSVGKGSHCGHIFFCDDFEVGEKEMEKFEKLMGLETQWIFISDIKDMIESGIIKDSTTISAFCLFQLGVL